MRVGRTGKRRLRIAASLLLLAGVTPGLFWRAPLRPKFHEKELSTIALPVPPESAWRPHLGAFDLEQIWQMKSRTDRFGGYSAMLVQPDGRLILVSDGGFGLIIPPPGEEGPEPQWFMPGDPVRNKRGFHDYEAMTADWESGHIWLAEEGINTIFRMGLDKRIEGKVAPESMRQWGFNRGPEAMVRLHDGRFVVLSEGRKGWRENQLHEAVLFAGDPIEHPEALRFTFDGPDEFDPTDMAQMPDGRVLILMRRLTWPMPQRFAGRIVIADPAQIREGGVWRSTVVAKLSSSLPIDNFEALAIAPRDDGKLTVWVGSDDNHGVFQRTLLWKLSVDPADL